MNTGKIKAKFLGDETDPRTAAMGIKRGKKYEAIIEPASLLQWLFHGFKLIMRLKENGRWWSIPYRDEAIFRYNWRIL